uniref:Uncharacterized protein n=1 Tax=Rhizophora mucronata TaxID=61149 RepID=A0A2P2P0E0_RHIMU
MASIGVPPAFLQLNQVVVGGGRLSVHHQRRRLRPFPIGSSSRGAASILNPTDSVAFPFTLPRAFRLQES